MPVVNLAQKYSNKVDERYYAESQALMGTNKDYDWEGVDTVKVYQVDTVPMNDYTRSGTSRYGTPSELGNTVQTMQLTRDRSFTFTIDKANRNQTMMVMEAGKSLSRQEREVIMPEYDRYIFGKQVDAAVTNNHFAMATDISSTNAYAKFLKIDETLGNDLIPMKGRIAYCSYGFCNLLMLDPAFIKYGDKSQEMVIRGELGEVDGVKIVKVPASQLPSGVSCLMVHPSATVAPQQLKEYKTHVDPPGINGWLVEGRHMYDAFVLDAKKNGLYVLFGENTLGTPAEAVIEESTGKLLSVPNADHYAGGKWQIKTGTTLPSYGDANTGYSDVTFGTTTVAADSILAYVIDSKIVAAELLDV